MVNNRKKEKKNDKRYIQRVIQINMVNNRKKKRKMINDVYRE